ncbi:Bax inhibitor-1/YccA family protein [Aestuariivirga litoralis]|uniref:Bax inhibitor-1/YccA family protein n=1 Tax=Aestuariivirga litoralis TaxID=2650924 RepID=UPI0018C71ABD|nr:Bax inhibitor-1/YccA family protein [Aestuariivirga litoralis]MBG1233676.1 Bax inhibitor-1/YccA family protein [Aestuariivirga litoralis]
MADYRGFPQSGTTTAGLDLGLRSYMLKVYNYMAGGLALTGAAALGTYSVAVQNGQLTPLGLTLFKGPLMWVLLLAPLAMVFFLSFRINKMSVGAAQLTFWAYAALVGVGFTPLALVYTGASLAQVFMVTAGTFGAVSLYGYTTKRDLTGFGSFLFMGLIGLIIASLVNIFLQSSAMSFALSVVGVLVFTGLTAYDTQKIKDMYYAGDDGTMMGRKAIMGALNLYLDFINLFLSLLRLMGDRR